MIGQYLIESADEKEIHYPVVRRRAAVLNGLGSQRKSGSP
jgi:hypothetical protein